MEEIIKKTWEENYRKVRKHKPLVWPDINVVKLTKYSDLPKGSKVLDLGCGECRNARFFLEEGYDLIGVDSSKTALDTCMKLYNLKQNSLINMDVYETLMEFSDESIDLVLCWGVLHYIVDYKKVVKEIFRVTKKGKFSIFSFTSNNDKRPSAAKIVHHFNKSEVVSILEGSGFKILKMGLTENYFFSDQKVESYYWTLVRKD